MYLPARLHEIRDAPIGHLTELINTGLEMGQADGVVLGFGDRALSIGVELRELHSQAIEPLSILFRISG